MPLFTLLEIDLELEAQNLGPLPYPLEVPVHGATIAERAALCREHRTEDPRLGQWLVTLTTARVSVDAVFLPEFDGEPIRAVAAANGRSAVLATQDTEGLRIRAIAHDCLVPAVVELLPPGDRGTMPSVTVPVRDETGPDEDDGRGVLSRVSDRRSVSVARQALARLDTLPRRRGGQLAVNSRSDTRGRVRSPVLAWFDNDNGRYFVHHADNWATIAPADGATLCLRLTEMLTALTD